MPDYWEFVRAIDKKTLGAYMLYLYRDQPGRVQIDHTCGESWEPPGYPVIPIGDQEGLEATIARDCGGGSFQLICKQRNNSAWITSTHFRIDLPSRAVNPWHLRRNPAPPTNGDAARTVTPGDPTAQIAARAMDVIAGQEHAAVNIGIDLFKAAGEVLKNRGLNGGGGLEEQLVRTAIDRALNPPPPPPAPDPIELLARIMNLQAQLNPSAATGNPIMGKIMDVALTRLLEPVNSAPAVSAGAEIVRTLPSIFAHGVEIAREWRMAMEAQRDGVVAMQQPPPRPAQAPPIPPPQVLPAAPVQTRPHATPSANPAIGGGGASVIGVPPSTEFVEQRIVELWSAPVSVEDAAENTMEFLDTLSGPHAAPKDSWVELLAGYGEAGLLQLFQDRPVLRQAVMANPARVRDFVRAFLRMYEEDKKEQLAAAAKPN